MLDDGPLLAPGCYPLPPSLQPAAVMTWLSQQEVPLLCELYTLSTESVLYEMALYRLQRPWQRPACTPGRLATLMRCFEEALRCFDGTSLLLGSRMLFKNHLEAGQDCIRLQPALERLLPVDATQPSDPNLLVPPAIRFARTYPVEGPIGRCVAEEVDRERWVFRDVDEEPRLSRPGLAEDDHRGALDRQLVLGADAKLAFSVALFVWAAVRLLARRIELLLQFPPDHPLFTGATQDPPLPKVYTMGDSLETLLLRRREVGRCARTLAEQGDWPGALETLCRAMDMALEGDEGLYVMFQHRANCFLHLNQPQRAVEDCTAALRHNPHAFVALYFRAQAYEALGRLDSAIEDATQLLRLYPGSAEARDLCAQLAAGLPVPGFPQSKSMPSPIRLLEAEPNLAASPPPASPACSVTLDSSSVGPLTFRSAQLSVDLPALPAHTEPPPGDDPPFLAAYLEGGTDLEYTVCPGRELGRGAFGRVYKAVHPRAGWLMAVKEVEARHFEADTDLLAALDGVWAMKHPNVVRTLALRRLPGFYHVVLEYCSGGNLRSLIDDLRGLPPPLLRKYAVEVLQGLRCMHGAGLLHRDVKSRNVLLSEDGTAKVADLGSCMRIPDGEETRAAAVRGTVLWMAPESFSGRYSTASDIWSFGCTLIEMTTAKDPWHEQHFKEQLLAMVFIATRSDSLPAAPPMFAGNDLGLHFFHCCIARDPADRVSADLLLRHPWLTGGDPSLSPLSPSSPRTTQQNSLGEPT